MKLNDKIRTDGPDYDKCLVNLANSILKKFHVETTADTLPLADEYLAKDYKNTVVILLDALGISILEKHLEKDGFFRSNLKDSYDSVYPPTTVAATTSILSGLYPNEHGWLGWDMFYPELGKNVTVFTNKEQMVEREGAKPTVINAQHHLEWGEDSLMEPEPAAEFSAGFRYTPYKSVVDKINEAGGTAYYSMPFMPPYPDSLEKILSRVKELCSEPGKKYIYAYWNEPDSTMHRTGTMSADTREMVRALEEKLSLFAEELSDTLLIITADHSHMDSKNLCILDYPEVRKCLKHMPSLEPRTLNLFVKEEYLSSFPEIFQAAFGDDFVLLTREEVMEEKLFGTGKDHPKLREMIGDYVALAVSDTSVFNTHYEAQVMPGGHAGMTAEECRIPLIIIEKNRDVRGCTADTKRQEKQNMVGKYPVITLCGSTRFKNEFLEAQKRLTLEGNIVISVGLFGHSGDGEVWEGMDEGTLSKTKEMLDDMHKRKIDMADSIYVINVNGYIGESTKSEIAYARSHGKEVRYLTEPETKPVQ